MRYGLPFSELSEERIASIAAKRKNGTPTKIYKVEEDVFTEDMKEYGMPILREGVAFFNKETPRVYYSWGSALKYTDGGRSFARTPEEALRRFCEENANKLAGCQRKLEELREAQRRLERAANLAGIAYKKPSSPYATLADALEKDG